MTRWHHFCPRCRAVLTAFPLPDARSLDAVLVPADDQPSQIPRIATAIGPLDKATAGGIPLGQIVLLGAGQGRGKTTLAYQIATATAQRAVLVNAEMSTDQSLQLVARVGKHRARHWIVASRDTDEAIRAVVAVQPQIAVFDSAQTLSSAHAPGDPGTRAQIAYLFERIAELTCASIVISQVRNDGKPRVHRSILHAVDAEWRLMGTTPGERSLVISKTRFGVDTTLELCLSANGFRESASKPASEPPNKARSHKRPRKPKLRVVR